MNSQLLDAEQHAASSACAQQRKKSKTTRRKAGEPITTLAQLDDREATRARDTLLKRFRETYSRLRPDPAAPNAANFPTETMMLIMQRENNSRTETSTTIYSSNWDETDNIIEGMMHNPTFRAAHRDWLRDHGLKMVPIDNNQPEGATSPISESSEASSSNTASPTPLLPALPSLPNNGRVTFGSTSDMFALADMED